MLMKFLILSFAVVLLFAAGEGSVLQAAQQKPPSSHEDLGNSYAKSGNYEQALIALNTAIQTNPGNARAYKLRGHVYYAMGNYSRSFNDLNHVVTLVPNSANALADRAIAHSVMGNHGLALADIDHALMIKPSSTFAQAVRKEILERAGR